MTALLEQHALEGIQDQDLLLIAERTLNGKRLSKEEALFLLHHEESSAICQLADSVRKKRVGDVVYFASTLCLYPTNLCELSCQFCSFYAKPGWKSAWFMTPEQLEDKIRQHADHSLTEVHIVGGLWRECNLDYYQELFARIKALNPNLHIKALTPVEYDFLARMHSKSLQEVLVTMKSWGLGSLPGGGAEILVEEIRRRIAPGKISSDEFLACHRLAHNLGLPSNITMLFGHIETYRDIAEHLDKVRTLQDETHGFQTFVPLKFGTENNALGKRQERLLPKDIKKVYAVSRLYLDNIRNLKVLWNYLGLELAKEILSCGANDFSSTHTTEKVILMAGGDKRTMTRQTMEEVITSCGKIPHLIHSGHDYSQDVAR